jgi:hypothetical protein
MKKPIVVGVVGCGYWGPNLVRNFKSLPDCELSAMCDLSEARLKHMRGLYPDVEGMTDFGQLLNGVGVDAVVVAARLNITSIWPKPRCSPGNIRLSKSRWLLLRQSAKS